LGVGRSSRNIGIVKWIPVCNRVVIGLDCRAQIVPASKKLHWLSCVGKWVPALAGKAKAGMVQSISGMCR